MSKKIQLIIGSTRQGRNATRIAEWVQAQAARQSDIELEVVDLKEWNLPIMDAPIPPLYAEVEGEPAAAWRAKLAEADGFIFLTPEYNRSIPASLKNALDYTVAEWNNKPSVIVSYGYTTGGATATVHLTDVLTNLRAKTFDTTTNIHFQNEWTDEQGVLHLTDENLNRYEADLQATLAQLAV